METATGYPPGIKHGDGQIPWILDAPIESSIYGGFPIAMFDWRVNLDLGQQSNSIVSISMASPSPFMERAASLDVRCFVVKSW